MAKIQLKEIYKSYDNKTYVVEDFNLVVNEKDFVVFVGPSGCGKTTVLRMIAGLENITSGEIYINEVLSNNCKPQDRDLAMIFQNYALYPHLSVYDNIAFSLNMKKERKIEIQEKVEKTADILGVRKLLDRKPKSLSGGEKQRVAMGRAIIRSPKAFLMDEPLSNLDAKLRTQMRIELKRLHKEMGFTIIYVTHDQIEAMTLGTRIVVMKDGIIQQIDSPENLYYFPINTFVASFIGSPQMNILSANILKKAVNAARIDEELKMLILNSHA